MDNLYIPQVGRSPIQLNDQKTELKILQVPRRWAGSNTVSRKILGKCLLQVIKGKNRDFLNKLLYLSHDLEKFRNILKIMVPLLVLIGLSLLLLAMLE